MADQLLPGNTPQLIVSQLPFQTRAGRRHLNLFRVSRDLSGAALRVPFYRT
jgi:hypothetical protein